jgi:2-polyprenyl-6-methoxyphenol hydroxylase-like FAD-dependent oxidoreductase
MRTSNFSRNYDVVVVGGGVAGVAAALAAARAGHETGLVEKTILPGGLATSGLVTSYTALCDGRGRQVTFGLAQELLHASLKYGPGHVSEHWREPDEKHGARRYTAHFCAGSFVLALDELLEEAGVDIWFDTLFCDALLEGDRLAAIEVENKSGRGRLRANCFVDATGDADVAHRAGAPCVESDNWLSLWAMEASLDVAAEAVETRSGAALNRAVRVGASNTGKGHPDGVKKFRGTDGREVSEFVLAGRRLLREHYQRKQAEAGRDGAFPITLPAMAQFRTTRRIDGQVTLEDGMHAGSFDDVVGLVANWWRPGEVWQVPFGALLPRKVRGLMAAGRCTSCEGEAWEVMRVIHAVAHTGEIAGTAAALAVEGGTMPDALDIGQLRERLRGHSFLFDYEEATRE